MTDQADQLACTEFVVETTPDDAAHVGNLGVASSVLASVEDRDRNYYLRGGMGVTTPTGLGLALSRDEEVVAHEGDGSLLMSLGCLSTVGAYDPSNLTIVVWNNAIYATTGGQAAASEDVDFGMAAESCGVHGTHVSDQPAFEDAFEQALAHDGAALVACDVARADPPAAEAYDYPGIYITQRFRDALGVD